MGNVDSAFVVARCSRTGQFFAICFNEISSGAWRAVRSFTLEDKASQKESSDSMAISGSIDVGSSYPGCPYCKAKSFFRCSCGKINCWEGINQYGYCQWCKGTIQFGYGGIGSLNVQEDL